MSNEIKSDVQVDVIGETCPIPLVEMRKAIMKTDKGMIVEVIGTHPASKKEIPMAVDSLGLDLLGIEEEKGVWRIFIKA